MSETTIQSATAAHQGELIETLSLAYQADPAISWLRPDAAERRRVTPCIMGIDRS